MVTSLARVLVLAAVMVHARHHFHANGLHWASSVAESMPAIPLSGSATIIIRMVSSRMNRFMMGEYRLPG